MKSHTDDIRALLAEAGKLPTESRTKLDLLDEAVRLADLHNDVPLGVEVRLALIHTGAALSRGDAMAVAFNWCLHHYDKQPEVFGGRDLLNEYSLVVNRLANFDTVSRPQLESLTDDLAVRLDRAGQPAGWVWIERILLSGDLGDRAYGARAAAELRRLRQERLLRPGLWFKHYYFQGDDAAALRVAETDLFPPGRAANSERAWFGLTLVLLRGGRTTDAMRWARRFIGEYAPPRDNYYWGFGLLAAALALAGQTADAVKLCAQCQRVLHATADPLTHLHFHLDMLILFDRLHADGTDTVLARFNDDVPGRLPNGRYVVREVRDWMRGRATELAARFDMRNGNDFFADQLHHLPDWQRYAQPTG